MGKEYLLQKRENLSDNYAKDLGKGKDQSGYVKLRGGGSPAGGKEKHKKCGRGANSDHGRD